MNQRPRARQLGTLGHRPAAPATGIIVLTAFQDDDKIFKAICAGAAGYLLKLSGVEQIIAAVREVQSGGAPINARIARRVLATVRPCSPFSISSAGDSPNRCRASGSTRPTPPRAAWSRGSRTATAGT